MCSTRASVDGVGDGTTWGVHMSGVTPAARAALVTAPTIAFSKRVLSAWSPLIQVTPGISRPIRTSTP